MFSHLGSFWIWVPNVKKTSHEVVRSSVFEIQCNCKQLAPWCKRLDSRLSGSELASRQFMWVSWWTERNLGKLFSGFLPFSPPTNSSYPFLHTPLIYFSSPTHVTVRQAWSAGIPAIQTYNKWASSHLIPLPGPVDTSSCIGIRYVIVIFVLKNHRTIKIIITEILCWTRSDPRTYGDDQGCELKWVYCTTWPTVARASQASTYSRRIAYIPANSNHINNFLE